ALLDDVLEPATRMLAGRNRMAVAWRCPVGWVTGVGGLVSLAGSRAFPPHSDDGGVGPVVRPFKVRHPILIRTVGTRRCEDEYEESERDRLRCLMNHGFFLLCSWFRFLPAALQECFCGGLTAGEEHDRSVADAPCRGVSI